ncbi:MAG: GAF domain-containing protein [Candidatus Eremiobacterota bacterium]
MMHATDARLIDFALSVASWKGSPRGAREAFLTRKTSVVEDTRRFGDHREPDLTAVAARGVLSFVSIPIVVRGSCVAVLNLDSTRPGLLPESASEAEDREFWRLLAPVVFPVRCHVAVLYGSTKAGSSQAE